MKLVTGATGFVGSRLVKALHQRGEEVRGFALRGHMAVRRDPGDARYEAISGDLLDSDAVDRAVAGCDAVFHCGAVIPGRGTPDYIWSVNVTGTANVVAACVRHRVRRLIHVSTDSIYGHGATAEATEDAPIQTEYFMEGNYPASKLAAEQLVRCAGERHALDTVILRPCMIYGPGPSPATELFAHWMRVPVKFLLGGGRSQLSVLYVDDLVAALVLAETAPGAAGQCFNISDGQLYAKRELLDQLIAASGNPRVVVPLAAPVVKAGFTALHPLVRAIAPRLASRVDVRRVLFAVEDHTVSCRKAIDLLGYRPQVPFADGIRRTVEWLAQHDRKLRHAA